MTGSASDRAPGRAPEPARKSKRRAGPARAPRVIGWMERIDLPDLGLGGLKVKIDTGARTSALHATDIQQFERDGAPWVSFMADSGHGLCDRPLEAPIHAERAIKNTSGAPEDRFVIRTHLRMGARLWIIDVSLSDRTNMLFPMIVGRTALRRHNIAVHTGRSFLATAKTPPEE
ncbi:ATP-dependent zinc protease family protein [Poseidonocella sedimentorum]|uniref:Uncharacterized conserved protein n=1 Tax=Poseidonocella sedimentorum TaxID=871652 RepID=A0A1I6E338_9RHOB|nr:RimK/LysX family protein [Poseidonocella sedimentorum]SFR12159.1 Uncharacterized conserved protein [Poseidonocella sedimentorum]